MAEHTSNILQRLKIFKNIFTNMHERVKQNIIKPCFLVKTFGFLTFSGSIEMGHWREKV